ncbi:NSN1, partial [Symbiodinium microadriaticum]
MKSQSYGQNSRRAFLKELRKIVDSSDVILHVLDARDPAGTRSTAIEEMVMSQAGKKLVYVVNKADLVPRNVLSGWLSYLRQYHPAVPFKCNTQNQKGNLGRTSGKVGKVDEGALLSHQAIGVEELLGLMKNYCRNNGAQSKTSISVGIVGMPNVGKSSLINSLTRTRAVNVSSTPGFTKLVQEVVLDKNIRLLDSPGVVFADGEMEDVITPVTEILNRCPPAYLMQLYAIPKFNVQDTMSFLALVARSTGKLKKGGIPHVEAAARGVLHDWNNGKIKYYCKPPDMSSRSSAAQIAAETARGDTMILSSYSEGLDLDSMEEADIQVLDALHAVDDIAFVPMESREFVAGEDDESGEAA